MQAFRAAELARAPKGFVFLRFGSLMSMFSRTYNQDSSRIFQLNYLYTMLDLPLFRLKRIE